MNPKVNRIRLQGFVMMESIFAMITVMICFGVCMMVFTTIASGSSNALQVKARIQLQTEADRCKISREFTDDTELLEEFIIERTFRETESGPHLIEMNLFARSPEGKTLAEYHELLLR